MSGAAYDGGGIATTVSATRAAADSELSDNLARLASELLRSGVTTFETKSGYGLTVGDELRSLEIAGRATAETTFLGAHVVPAEYRDRRDDYVRLVAGDMLAACAPRARWIDVFCDRGAFDVDEARTILQAGADAGPRPAHARLPTRPPGRESSSPSSWARRRSTTARYADDGDLEALAASTTVATLLPGAEFSTRAPWPDGRRFVDAGVTIALATDCNPGTSYTTSMPFCIALAVRDMHLTPAEALRAATAGGAAALRRDDIGVLAPGMRADFVTLDAPSYIHLAYRPGVPIVDDVVQSGAPTQRKQIEQ